MEGVRIARGQKARIPDCHRPEDVGVSATLTEEKIDSIEKYLELMRAGKLILSIGSAAV